MIIIEYNMKMSKAIRIVTEETPPHISLFSFLYSHNLDSMEPPPPCFPEFIQLLECTQANAIKECHVDYFKFLKCFQKSVPKVTPPDDPHP